MAAALLWLAMIVCGLQVSQASCGDYLLMDEHVQAGSEHVGSLEWSVLRTFEVPSKPTKPCHGPGCRQAPTESLQGIPATSNQRLTDLPVAVTPFNPSWQFTHGSVLSLLAKRVGLSAGFPEGVFRPPVMGV